MAAPPLSRCPWCGIDPVYTAYHDTEWGVPCHDEQRLFEFLVLEGAQAGLSWITILKKRANYRRAFDGFDAAMIARYDERDLARLLGDSGIVRNRLKISAAIDNARATVKLWERDQSLDTLLWDHAGGQPVVNTWRHLNEVPVNTPIADKLSRELKKLGYRFVGPTIIYSLMQATGMVNDHLITCHCHPACAAPSTSASGNSK